MAGRYHSFELRACEDVLYRAGDSKDMEVWPHYPGTRGGHSRNVHPSSQCQVMV